MINSNHIYQQRIENIVDQLVEKNQCFQELDKTEMINRLIILSKRKYPVETFQSISEEDLRRRVGQVMAIEGLFHLLDGFTPEEKIIFNDAVQGN